MSDFVSVPLPSPTMESHQEVLMAMKQQLEILAKRPEIVVSTSPPSTALSGSLWINKLTGVANYFDGSGWKPFA